VIDGLMKELGFDGRTIESLVGGVASTANPDGTTS
jgi:hypothetical protein